VTVTTRTIASSARPEPASEGGTQSGSDDRSGSRGGVTPVRQANQRFRILALMAQGTPGVLPEAWQCYVNLDEARTGARTALRDARVLKVAIVEDNNKPLRLVEWIDGTPNGA
jgi:hypothetical protein